MIKTIAMIAAPFALLIGLGVYDASATTTVYQNDMTLSGHQAIFAVTHSRSGMVMGHDKLMGYGHARLIGFGCNGKTLIANEEDYFPKCKAIVAVERY